MSLILVRKVSLGPKGNMSQEHSTPSAKTVGPDEGKRRVPIVPFLLDLVLVIIFAALGRSTHHDEIFGAWGTKLWTTSWPFVAALALGWLVLRIWRTPISLRRGLGLWLVVVVVGLTLRGLTGGGLALPFVLVATGTLLVFLVGWRAIANLTARRSRPTIRGTF